MKKKIILVVNEFQNIINFRLSLINYLINKNINLSIICYSNNIIKTNKINKYTKVPVYFLSGTSKGKSLVKELTGIFSLFKLIKNLNPDLILSYTIKPNIYSLLISKLLKKNIIITLTGLGSTYLEGGLFQKFVFLLYRYFNNTRASFVFQNKYDLNVFKIQKILNRRKFFLIPGSGIDIIEFKKDLNYIYNNNQKTFNFLFIGRLIKHKGLEEFYFAAEKLLSVTRIKIKFLIIGSYNKEDTYSISHGLFKMISNNNNFRIINHTNNVVKFIKQSNCVVLSSKREGMPKSLLEASSIGRPLISSDVPGSNEIVIDGFNGYTYESGNIEDLFLKMFNMINLPKKKIITFCNNANKHVKKNFSTSKINDMYYEIIKKNI